MDDNEAAPHPLSRLSSGQLDVVRLVAELKSSKLIARELGISSHTVDQRLKRVQAILGVEGRAEAARLYQVHAKPGLTEQTDELWANLVYQPSDLSKAVEPGDEGPSPGDGNRSGDGPAALHLSQAPYEVDFDQTTRGRPWYSVLVEAGRTNDLTPLARTVCISVITIGSVLSLAAVVSLAEGLSRLF